MCPDIICAGEMLVEIMRAEVGVPHLQVGGVYKGPYPSGAPCIFIDSAARMAEALKITTGFIGTVGNDDFGQVVIDKMKADGVDCSAVSTISGSTTGIAFVQYNKDGSRKFIFAAGAAGQLTEAHVKDAYFEGVKDFHVMGSAMSISPTSKAAVLKAIDLTVKNGGIVSFDPNLRAEMMPLDQIREMVQPVIKKTTILLPSGEEAMLLTGDKDAKSACESLLKAGPEIVVLKEAKDGCTVYTRKEAIKVPGFKVKEVDPTGAGDSFGGAFVVEYLVNAPLEEAARFANAVGALKVTSFGPMASNSREGVEQFIASQLK
ncbi:MAG: sugar kinase [Candidatus Lokiarchaeota archaeon]|nr:sugar kinase [Candidatus Lokiarchaeota archaeon]